MQLAFRSADHRDHASTRQLVDRAFRPEDVVTFLDGLRADGCVLGEWVAEEAGSLVGHIVFSRVWVDVPEGDRLDAAMLTPLAVRPDRQRCGVGARLTDHALRRLEAQGETRFFVLGHPGYYPRVGFSAAVAAAIASPWSGNPAFMARGAVPAAGRLVMPSVIADAH